MKKSILVITYDKAASLYHAKEVQSLLGTRASVSGCSVQEVLDVLEKALLLFRDQGIPGERFADTIARLGFENVEAQLLSDDLLQRKEEILGKHTVGGATC